jgi:hypothetical protein
LRPVDVGVVLEFGEEGVDVCFVVVVVARYSSAEVPGWIDCSTYALMAACRTRYAAFVTVHPSGGLGSRGGSLGSKYGAMPARCCSGLKLYVSYNGD